MRPTGPGWAARTTSVKQRSSEAGDTPDQPNLELRSVPMPFPKMSNIGRPAESELPKTIPEEPYSDPTWATLSVPLSSTCKQNPRGKRPKRRLCQRKQAPILANPIRIRVGPLHGRGSGPHRKAGVIPRHPKQSLCVANRAWILRGNTIPRHDPWDCHRTADQLGWLFWGSIDRHIWQSHGVWDWWCG